MTITEQAVLFGHLKQATPILDSHMLEEGLKGVGYGVGGAALAGGAIALKRLAFKEKQESAADNLKRILDLAVISGGISAGYGMGLDRGERQLQSVLSQH